MKYIGIMEKLYLGWSLYIPLPPPPQRLVEMLEEALNVTKNPCCWASSHELFHFPRSTFTFDVLENRRELIRLITVKFKAVFKKIHQLVMNSHLASDNRYRRVDLLSTLCKNYSLVVEGNNLNAQVNVPFLNPLKTSENRRIIGLKWYSYMTDWTTCTLLGN